MICVMHSIHASNAGWRESVERGGIMLLEGKVVLVTGAARGVGMGVARAMGLAGARVCATDVADDELAATLAEMEAEGSEAWTQHLDVTDLSAFKETVQAVVARWDRLDVIVHCAILMPLVLFEDTPHAVWWRHFDINLGGFYNATRAAWDLMKAQGGGHVIGVASGSSFRGYKYEVSYCAGKHAIEGFIKALALECAPYSIALNTVGPSSPIKPTGITREELEKIPLEEKARWADPVRLGRGFVWLAAQSPERFSGFRFDAGVIADTIAVEGYDFEFAPEKVTVYPEDFVTRRQWMAEYLSRYPE
jgi:NAD(P)-dependent dehydrogenase (short-subunit alcohol dehydrogenase family)